MFKNTPNKWYFNMDFIEPHTFNDLSALARDPNSIYGVPLRDVPLSVVVAVTGAPSVLLRAYLTLLGDNFPGAGNVYSYDVFSMPSSLTGSLDRFVRLGDQPTPLRRVMDTERYSAKHRFPYFFDFLCRAILLGYDHKTRSGRCLSEVESRLLVNNDYRVFDDPRSVDGLLDSEVHCNPTGLNQVALVGVEKRKHPFLEWYNGRRFVAVEKGDYSALKPIVLHSDRE